MKFPKNDKDLFAALASARNAYLRRLSSESERRPGVVSKWRGRRPPPPPSFPARERFDNAIARLKKLDREISWASSGMSQARDRSVVFWRATERHAQLMAEKVGIEAQISVLERRVERGQNAHEKRIRLWKRELGPIRQDLMKMDALIGEVVRRGLLGDFNDEQFRRVGGDGIINEAEIP